MMLGRRTMITRAHTKPLGKSENMAQCTNCGRKLGFLENTVSGECLICNDARLAKLNFSSTLVAGAETEEERENRELEDAICRILVTTEMQPDIAIKTRVGIVSAEVAYGMNIFKDLFSSVRNIVGGRSEAIQKTMRDSRETVLFELKREAHALGANAIVAIDLDYTQIGDGGWGMVLVVATGTAVIVDDKEVSSPD